MPKRYYDNDQKVFETYLNTENEIIGKSFSEILSPPPSIKFSIWEKLCMMTGGFRMNELTLFTGSTGAGKTDFVANISANLCLNQIKHLVFSVETGDHDFWRRTFSVLTGKDYNDGEKHELDDLKKNYAKWKDVITPYQIVTKHDDRIRLDHLGALIEYAVMEKGVKFVIMDNLNFFMNPASESGMILEMDKTIHELVIMAKELPAHLFLICHPRKPGEQFSQRVESEYDIKGSSTAVQEAHNILLFNRPDNEMLKQNEISEFDRDLKIAKCRRKGKYVGKGVIFKWNNRVYEEKAVYDYRSKAIHKLHEVTSQGIEQQFRKSRTYHDILDERQQLI